jgi:hypothetical protein
MKKTTKLIEQIGFSPKAAQVYVAALELGESTVQLLAEKSGLKRTTITEADDSIAELEALQHAVYKKPRLYFLYGPGGFKQIWEMIFTTKSKHFMIMTDGVSFLDFVKEKYILDENIRKKRELGISSHQIIVDSEYARKIVAKDVRENRQSKLLSRTTNLPFTKVISDSFVAFISPRWDNTLFVVENHQFAETEANVFKALWEKL